MVVGGELLSQATAGPMQTRTGCRDRDPEDAGDLDRAELLPASQEEELAIVVVQPPEGPQDRLSVGAPRRRHRRRGRQLIPQCLDQAGATTLAATVVGDDPTGHP